MSPDPRLGVTLQPTLSSKTHICKARTAVLARGVLVAVTCLSSHCQNSAADLVCTPLNAKADAENGREDRCGRYGRACFNHGPVLKMGTLVTDKIRQGQMLVPKIRFSEEQWARFEEAGKLVLHSVSREIISGAVDQFIANHIEHFESVPPSKVVRILEKLSSSLEECAGELGQFLQFAEEDGVSSRKEPECSQGDPLDGTISYLEDVKELSIAHRGNNIDRILALDVAKYLMENAYEDRFGRDSDGVIYCVYHALKRLKVSSEQALRKIESGTGAPERDYLHVFLVQLSNVFENNCCDGKYSDGCISYIMSVCGALLEEFKDYQEQYPLQLRALSKESVIHKMKYKSKKDRVRS